MTSNNYGATGQSWLPVPGSFDLNADPEDEDEYDYLPIPEGEDDASSQGRTRSAIARRIPFSRIHQPPVPFDDRDRQCFMSGNEILVEIVAIDQSDHSKILNPNLYVVQISHGEYKWTVRRRYKHFRSLHDSLYLFKLQTTIPMPTKEARDRRKFFAKTKDTTKFPKRPEPLVRSDGLEERKLQLQGYLKSILNCPFYRNHQETLKFLEVSHLSFVSGLGEKYKEGMIEKRAGGRRIALHCCSFCTCCSPGQWQERYLILKDTFVAYLRPSDGTISDVLLMDRDFSVKYGLLHTGINSGLLISNLSRHLLVKCWTQRKAHEWHDDIAKAIKEKGQDYTQPNRFNSFVPMRPSSYVNWFVDGASYMAAVADALEAAKEEIFITDWMLSPELHLKRPVMEGDRWRLDIILQRKAREGVKVFILVYKEMEMALGINSFYTKHCLASKHENILVMRHPDGIKLWSHHEKCVVIDQRLAFLGGIDLCYGRWDTRKHRLTDLGSLTLNNIFGIQDTDTLENVIHNVPNIVPKKDSLVSPTGAPEGVSNPFQLLLQSSAAVRPSHLESIPEISPKQVDIHMASGSADANRASGSSTSSKSSHGKSGKHSSKSPKNGGVARNSDGYSNPALVDDSPNSPISPESFLSSEESKSEEYAKRTKYSVFGNDIQSSPTNGPHSSEMGSPPGNGAHQTQSPLDTSPISGDPGTPKRDGNDVLQPTASEISLTQATTTLQTFLKNLSERNTELAEALRLEGNKSLSSSVEALDLQRQKQGNGVEAGMHGSSAHKREVLSRLSRRQTYDGANTAAESSTTANRPKDLTIVEPRIVDGMTEKELAKVLGPIAGEKTEGKPVTPTIKRKLKWKTVVDTKIMLQKQMSVDVGGDNPNRTWDESVFHAKEQEDVIDGQIDAQLSRQKSAESLKIWVGKDYVNFIYKDFVELDNPFTDMVDRTVTPRMPWHDIGVAVFGKPARDVARHFIQRWNFTKLQKRKTNVGIPMLLPKSSTSVPVPKWAINSAFCSNTQILRSACEWSAGIKLVENSIQNAYTDLIMNAKHYIYIENQFFITITKDKVVENQLATSLFEKIVQAHRSGKTFRVYVVMPLLPAFEGQLGTSTGTSIQAVIHWNYTSICRGGNSLLERLVKAGVHDPFEYISFYGLRKHEKMLGKLMTELIYVHSKLMIVDDFSVIIGSANINDRSLLGSRDSELAVLVQDVSSVDSRMNGEPYKAGAFACSLRKSLFREHLGVETGDSTDVSDPICAEFYKNVWLKQASINTTIYEKVFGCIPTDAVMTISQLREFEKKPKLAEKDPDLAKVHLERVKGHVVLLPLQFLANETLTPAPGTKEALAPTVIWT